MLRNLISIAIITISSLLLADIEKPNILILFADDLGYEQLGCYGGPGMATPSLDQMANQGMRFTRAYTSAVCTPSRMSFYTGTYVAHHGYSRVLPVHLGSREAVDFGSMPCYAQSLREQGYLTSVTGKWQLGGLEFHPDHVKSAGFDSWCVWQIWREGKKTKRYWNPTLNQDGKVRTDIADRYGPDVLTEYVIGQMRQARERGRPFLIHHNMMLPHFPISQTPDDIKSGAPASLDRMIKYMDKQVGILLEAIKQLDVEQETYVFFMGDNGTDTHEPRRTEQGLVTGGKHQLNDGGTHVPLIVWAPGRIASGSVCSDLVETADFFPTLCELAGADLPDSRPIDGRSFVDPLLEKGSGLRSYVTAGLGDDFFVFDGEWRLHLKEDQLFDCRELPNEKLADKDCPVARDAYNRLRAIMDGILAKN